MPRFKLKVRTAGRPSRSRLPYVVRGGDTYAYLPSEGGAWEEYAIDVNNEFETTDTRAITCCEMNPIYFDPA